MLFMIDTCQANTMFSKFYSPNIIGAGSSELGQSSYSHHADNDVGVAVIDRYTYYNLDFLESQVKESSSKKTLGDLFNSYDRSKIHSNPGMRYDLFPGGEKEVRKRLVMDFFGNSQNVEIEPSQNSSTSRWLDDMQQLVKMAKLMENGTHDNFRNAVDEDKTIGSTTSETSVPLDFERPTRISSQEGWSNRKVGISMIFGSIGMLALSFWVDSRG